MGKITRKIQKPTAATKSASLDLTGIKEKNCYGLSVCDSESDDEDNDEYQKTLVKIINQLYYEFPNN
jgi:hypothetical protein